MERKRRQAATAGRPAVAACDPDHTPRTGFQNHRVFGNILGEAKVQPRVTFSSEAIRAVIQIDALYPSPVDRLPLGVEIPARPICAAAAEFSAAASVRNDMICPRTFALCHLGLLYRVCAKRRSLVRTSAKDRDCRYGVSRTRCIVNTNFDA